METLTSGSCVAGKLQTKSSCWEQGRSFHRPEELDTLPYISTQYSASGRLGDGRRLNGVKKSNSEGS